MDAAGSDGKGTSGRGFGGASPAKASSKKRRGGRGRGASVDGTLGSSPSPTPSPTPTPTRSPLEDEDVVLERGRQLLEKMRLESGAAAPREAPSKLRGPALTPEELEPLDPAAGVMPEVVSQRMLRRIVPFASVGVVGSIVTFAGFWYANTQLELDLPPQIVAYVTQALLLLSFAGVTYGVMSTSWDEEREGSLLGVENLQRNFDLMRGNEAERIATAQMEQELEDAEKAGIMTSRAALKRRDQRQGGMRADDP